MSKIVLLNPPSFEDSRYINRDLMGGLGISVSFGNSSIEKLLSIVKANTIRFPVIPMGYMASILKSHNISVVDAGNTDISTKQVVDRISKIQPDYIISSTSISHLNSEVSLVDSLKKTTDAKAILFGESASFFSNKIMEETNIDFIIKGEPETSIKNVVEGSLEDSSGLIYRKNGDIIQNSFIFLDSEALDNLPFPDWSKFPIKNYQYTVVNKKPFLTILSSRGCPYGCLYCPYTANMGRKWRGRSSESVVSELIYLKDNFKVKGLEFRDPLFTFDNDRIMKICDGIIENSLDIKWGCETRIDCLTEKLADKMADAGWKGVNVGLETVDENVLNNVKKKIIDKDKISHMISYVDDLGVSVVGLFVMGLPGDTRESIQKTIEFSLSLNLTYADYKIFTPYPNTPLYDIAKEKGWLTEFSTDEMTSYKSVVLINEELDENYLSTACGVAFRRFYMRPKVIKKIVLRRFRGTI